MATVGNDGFVGLPVFWGAGSFPLQAFVQVAGEGLKVAAPRFAQLAARGTALHDVLQRYVQAVFVSVAQSAACNRVHDVQQRCARWILMTHDRVGTDEFSLTHEFLAQMLGVRRAGVSAAAAALQRAGCITYVRGRVMIINRRRREAAACMCYALIRREFERLLPS